MLHENDFFLYKRMEKVAASLLHGYTKAYGYIEGIFISTFLRNATFYRIERWSFALMRMLSVPLSLSFSFFSYWMVSFTFTKLFMVESKVLDRTQFVITVDIMQMFPFYWHTNKFFILSLSFSIHSIHCVYVLRKYTYTDVYGLWCFVQLQMTTIINHCFLHECWGDSDILHGVYIHSLKMDYIIV